MATATKKNGTKRFLPNPEEGRHLALYMIEEGDRDHADYWHLRAKLCIVGHPDGEQESSQGKVYFGDFGTEDGRYGFADDALRYLEVYSQGNGRDADRRLYAWQVQAHDLCRLTLDEARILVAILETIDQRMRKEEDRFGTCQTYGQYVCRVARALGCEFVLFAPSVHEGEMGRRRRTWKNGYDYQTETVGSAAARIDRIVSEWVTWRTRKQED